MDYFYSAWYPASRTSSAKFFKQHHSCKNNIHQNSGAGLSRQRNNAVWLIQQLVHVQHTMSRLWADTISSSHISSTVVDSGYRVGGGKTLIKGETCTKTTKFDFEAWQLLSCKVNKFFLFPFANLKRKGSVHRKNKLWEDKIILIQTF